jgi:hypothetical protein
MALRMEQKDNVVDIQNSRPTVGGKKNARPTEHQRTWLIRGLKEPGGKLPLFDASGKRVNERTIRSCIEQGWAEHWFSNPIKPDWLVCKLTDRGRAFFNNS